MKRVLSIFLAALMIFSVFGVACYASNLPSPIPVSSLENTEDGIKISWDSNNNCYEYQIWKNENGNGWEPLTTEFTSFYVDRDVEDGSTYSYKINGVNYAGPGGFGEEKTIQRISEIKPTLKVLVDGVTISWKRMPGCDSYKIYRGTVASDEMILIKTVDGDTLKYTDKKAKNGITNVYNVVGVSGNYEGATPDILNDVFFIKSPKIKSVKNAGGRIYLSWAKNPMAESYIIYRKKIGGKYKRLTATYDTYFYDETAKSGEKYIYGVQSFAMDHNSKTAESKAIIFLAKTTVYAVNIQNGVKVSWAKVKGAQGYKIYRKVGNGKLKFLKKVSAKATSYVDKKASPGKYNSYVVKAYKSSVEVGSDAIKICYLKMPVIKSIKATANGAKLTWSKVPGATEYYVFEKNSNGYRHLNTVKGTQFTDVTIKTGRTKKYTIVAYNKKSNVESAASKIKKVKQTVKNKQAPSRDQMAGYAIAMLNVKLINPSSMRINQIYYKGDTVYIWYSAANAYGNMVDGWVSCYHSSQKSGYEYSVVYKKGYICVSLNCARPNSWDGLVSVKKAMETYDMIPEFTWYNPWY